MRRSVLFRSNPIVVTKNKTNIQTIREKVLLNTLLGSLILGAVALGVAVPARVQSGQNVLAALYLVFFTWLLVVTLLRHLPYNLRVFSLLFVIFLLGVTTLISDGLYGNGRIFFIALPVIASILMGSLAGLWILFLSGGFIALTAYFSWSGIISLPSNELIGTVHQDSMVWSLGIMVFILVGGTLLITIVSMLQGIRQILASERELRADLDDERAQLERRVILRTQGLEGRLAQIRTAGEISTKINAILDPQEIYHQVVEWIRNGFDLYFVGIYEINAIGDQVELKAATGDAGRQMVAESHRLPLNSLSIVGSSISNQKARIALDVGQDAVQFNYPLLPQTRSEIVIPLLTSRSSDPLFRTTPLDPVRSCLGAITLHSFNPMAFDSDDVAIYQGIASSLATALENAKLFQHVRQSLEDISTLNRQYLRESWAKVMNLHGVLSYEAKGDIGLETEGRLDVNSIPLVLRDQVIGLLSLENKVQEGENYSLTPEDRTFVDAVITQAALALENVRLLEETQKRASNERLLAEISRKARGSTDLEAILRMAVREIGLGMGASEALISLEVPAIEPGSDNILRKP